MKPSTAAQPTEPVLSEEFIQEAMRLADEYARLMVVATTYAGVDAPSHRAILEAHLRSAPAQPTEPYITKRELEDSLNLIPPAKIKPAAPVQPTLPPLPKPDLGSIQVNREEVRLGHSDEAMTAYALAARRAVQPTEPDVEAKLLAAIALIPENLEGYLEPFSDAIADVLFALRAHPPVQPTEPLDERAGFEAWVEEYGLRFEPDYTKLIEIDCNFAFKAGIDFACAHPPVQPTEWNAAAKLDAYMDGCNPVTGWANNE